MKKIIKIQNSYIVLDKITDFEIQEDWESFNLYVSVLGVNETGEGKFMEYCYETEKEAEADLKRLIKAIEGEQEDER